MNRHSAGGGSILNLAAGELPSRFTSIDMTAEKLYSLTDTSEELAKNLSEDVTIYILQSEERQDTTPEADAGSVYGPFRTYQGGV